jgi:hypothetical protein
MKGKYDSSFVKAAEIPGNVCKGKVLKLENGQQYKFRIRAVNKAGIGEPSEESLPHIAKAKFSKLIIKFFFFLIHHFTMSYIFYSETKN